MMMIWRFLPSCSLMKMINVSRQEEHLMHEGDRMATVMGFLSEVSEICCVYRVFKTGSAPKISKCKPVRKF